MNPKLDVRGRTDTEIAVLEEGLQDAYFWDSENTNKTLLYWFSALMSVLLLFFAVVFLYQTVEAIRMFTRCSMNFD